MRDHLIRCLENSEFEPFPGQKKNKRKREEPNVFEIEMLCNDAICATTRFHFRYVNVTSMDESEQWLFDLFPKCTLRMVKKYVPLQHPEQFK